MTSIDRPIFVVGNVRSGTTIAYNLLAVSKAVCWISNYSDRYWRWPGVSLCHRVLDVPGMGAHLRRAIAANRRPRYPAPWPREGDEIYHACAGFGHDPDGFETVLTPEMEKRLRGKIAEHLRCTGRQRFLSKQTANNRRLELLQRMFPDAFCLHVIRDGRAVANSTLRVPWWRDTYVWWLGQRVREWEADGGEPAALAAMHWQRNVDAVQRSAALFGERYKEIRYESLVADVRGVIADVSAWCDLPVRAADVPEALPDRNQQWRRALNAKQVEAIEAAVGAFLRELGY